MFDPYHKWLGIQPGRRPPTHYQLLGIAASESDLEVIEEAFIRQTTHLRTYQNGAHALECTKLLNELAQAHVTLMDVAKRQEYDAELEEERVYAGRAKIKPFNAPIAQAPVPMEAPAPRPPRRARPKHSHYDYEPRKPRLPVVPIVAGVVLVLLLLVGLIVLLNLPDKKEDKLAANERGNVPAKSNAAPNRSEPAQPKPPVDPPSRPPIDDSPPTPPRRPPVSPPPEEESKPPERQKPTSEKPDDKGAPPPDNTPPPTPDPPPETPKGDQPTKPTVDKALAAAGFNDAKGINSDRTANSPYALGQWNRQGGRGEPGWEGPWPASDKVVYQNEIVAEGDGAAYLTGTVNFTRRLQRAQTGVFQVEQYVRVPPGGAMGCYVWRRDGHVTCGPMWNMNGGLGLFSVLEGNEILDAGRWREVGPCAPDQWYKVTVIIDVPKRRWQFLVDDQKLAENIGFRTRQNALQEINYLVENREGAFLDAIRVGPVNVKQDKK